MLTQNNLPWANVENILREHFRRRVLAYPSSTDKLAVVFDVDGAMLETNKDGQARARSWGVRVYNLAREYGMRIFCISERYDQPKVKKYCLKQLRRCGYKDLDETSIECVPARHQNVSHGKLYLRSKIMREGHVVVLVCGGGDMAAVSGAKRSLCFLHDGISRLGLCV